MILPGVIASSGGVASSYESIQTYTLTTSTASVSFSSIASTWKHLQIRYLARNTGTGGGLDNVGIRANTDSGTNYTYHVLYGNGTSALASAALSRTYALTGLVANGGNTASIFSAGVIDILDYSTSGQKNKTFRSLSGADFNGSGLIGMESSVWMNTNAITQLDIYSTAGSFVQYSSFALYGVKA